MKNRSLVSAMALVPAVGLILSGCASQGSEPAAGTDDQTLSIVATTNVYADIAREVAGEYAEVESVITSAAQDPHSYEPTARDKLTLSKASIVLANGGGYDMFMDTVVESLPAEQREAMSLIHAVDHSPVPEEFEAHEHEHEHEDEHEDHDHADQEHGHEGHQHAEYNEHLWYDLDSMQELASALAEELSSRDAQNAQTYQQNAQTFGQELEGLRAELSDAGLEGRSYIMTEPVPFHLVDDAGMKNATPEGLSEAIEEGEGVAPLTLKKTEDTLAANQADMLLYNIQTEGPETQTIRAAAEKAGIPVVDLSETITDDSTYLQWMAANIDKLASAAEG